MSGEKTPTGRPREGVIKKKYESFKYSIKDLEYALEAVRLGQSLNKVAFQFNIPKATLSTKLRGKTIEGRRMGPQPVLSFEEEKLLEDWIVGKAKIGFPMHKDEVKDAVYNVMKETGRKNPFTNNRPGEKWVTLFLKRHPCITQRNAEIISKGKACLTEANIREWFTELQKYLEENNNSDILLDGDRIYNADETGVECCPKTGKVLGPKNYKDFYTIAPGKEKESITVLANFSASGKKVPPMVIFPYQRIPRDIIESVPPNYFIGRSDSGWMVSPTFYEYVANCFYPWLIKNGIKFPILFLLDGHKSHINLELSKFCSEKQILLFSFLPNATNVLQPCDVGVFRPLKASWRASVRRWKQKNGTRMISRGNFTPIFKEAFDSSVDAVKIQNAFKKCGIFPFDVENVDFNKCMQHRHRALVSKKVHEQRSLSEKKDEKFLQTLESELPPDMLESFKATLIDKSNTPNLQEPVLFSIWKKYALKERNIVEENNNDNKEGILNIDFDMNSNEKIEATLHPITNFETEECTNLSPCPLKESIPEVWKNHLHWPNIGEKDKNESNRKKKKFPFAVSSEKWQKCKEAERAEKEIREENRKRKRQERVSKKEEKFEEGKRKKAKKIFMKTKEEISSDDTIITMHESDSSLGNLEDQIKHDSSDSESQDLPFLSNIRINQSYVIIEYEKKFFPGLVTNKRGQKYQVSTMAICGPQGLNWKWPEVEDKIWYFHDQIKEIIKTPELVSATSSRFSGVYLVPELKKYTI